MTPDPTGPLANTDATALLEAAIDAAKSPANRHSFLQTSFDAAMQTARAMEALRIGGQPMPALAGMAISVKDLFDVRGEVTSAGSKLLAQQPPAADDCPAVARLRRAGAAFMGRTNMSEFAFSGVGINPHFGTPPNPATAFDAQARIPGGSTSGGAVTVATGAARAALGSDTGGSIRIPAALQGLVGFKSTARLVPTEGAIPLSTTLDTVCAITRSVRDAVLLHEVLADRRVVLPLARPLSALPLAVPRTLMLDALDPIVSSAFERVLSTLRAGGAHIEEIALPELAEVASINAAGGFAPAEAWAWHRHRLAAHETDYDPRVAQRIRRGERMSAADYIDLLHARRDWIARMGAALTGFDALLSPTVPLVAPPLAPLLADDDAFFATNTLLLRNPSVVNLLDGCALSLPCHAPGEFPVGLMVWNSALHDDAVLAVSLAIEAALGAALA